MNLNKASIQNKNIHTSTTKTKKTSIQKKDKHNVIYLREKEIEEIETFLNSKEKILHICGNPGTGKTSVTLFTLRDRNYVYLNAQQENLTIKKILSKRSGVIVIDEFDTLYNIDKLGCKNLFNSLKNQKLVTISNNLNSIYKNLFFTAYKKEEIEFIVRNKMMEEKIDVDEKFIGEIVRKCLKSGDIREAIEYCRSLNDDIYCIDKENEPNNENLHKKIIFKVMKEGKVEMTVLYEKYIVECKEMAIPFLNRNDFKIICEMIE